MKSHVHQHSHDLIARGSVIAARVAALTLAPMLIVAGLGMSMSVVLLPFGVFFGVGGVLLFVWGLFE